MPWTSYPLSISCSARYEPSWPVMPVMRAFFTGGLRVATLVSPAPHGANGLSVRSRVSRLLRWPSIYRSLVFGRLTVRHYVGAVRGDRTLRTSLPALARYLRDSREYRRLPGAERLRRYDDNPQLFD